MDNQHRKIKGYRELTQGEIDRMNRAKQLEREVLEFINDEQARANSGQALDNMADPRWLAIAKTDIQKGFMSLGRAIARPDGYESVEEREAGTTPESEGLQD